MAATAWTVYSNAALEITNGSFDLASNTFYVILLTASYTPAPNTDTLYSDISANEVAAGSGYATGGVTLTGVTNTLSGGTVTFNSANPSWASFSATFRYAAIIQRAGASPAGTDKLLCYTDSGTSITGGGGTFTITMNASGIFTATHSP